MSIPSPLNLHGHLSPVDVDLDILTETDAEAIDAGAENSGFGDSVDLDDADLPGSGSDRGTNATTTDSAVSSGTEAPSGVSSRRSSNNPFSDFKDYVRSRRQTVTSRFPSRLNNPPTSPLKAEDGQWRKVSADSQFDFDTDEDLFATTYQRRMSVPEKTLRNANYAILRKSVDRRCFEIVGAFNKHHGDAYRHFMQSLTCYDLAPQHGLVIVLHADLSVQKAVTVLCQNPGNRVAVVQKHEDDGYFGVFTVTDCLQALKQAGEEAALDSVSLKVSKLTLKQYLEQIPGRKRVVTALSTMTIWDVSRLFRMNRVHRIPVLQVEDYIETKEILSFVCLRQIFLEVLKLLDSKAHLTPNLCHLTLDATRVGTWTKLSWISENALVSDAVTKFLNCKVSCLPLLDEDEHVVGVVSKNDVLDAVAEHAKNYLEVLDLPVKASSQ
ncbi:CBS domain containing protein [Aphelenchoides avenae]|nr:CBS domain containing protein [Aphelenchus avenae]